MNISDFKKIISIISDIGVQEIDMLGGEPTLHPEFSQIIDIICSKKLKITISTNGSHVEILEKIMSEYNNGLITVGVSVNSEEISRELRNYLFKYKPLIKSVFSKKCNIPETARKYLGVPGMKYYLLFMDTVCEEDLASSVPFHEFFKTLQNLKDTQSKHLIQDVW